MSTNFAGKNVQFNFGRELNRRAVLRGVGVSMALPWLSAMSRSIASEKETHNASSPLRSGWDCIKPIGSQNKEVVTMRARFTLSRFKIFVMI